MKVLFVLVITFVISVFVIRFWRDAYDLAFAGRIAMSVMLAFTAIGHFAYADGMAMMLPAAIPYKKAIVHLTGVIEIAAAIGLQVPSLVQITAWLLILFFILILPANIHAAIQQVDFQKGNNDGPGKRYLWFRVPLQLLFIAWTYLSAIGSINI